MNEYQRVVAEIDLDAIAYNMKNIKKTIDSNAKIMGIVKADAYGHGAVEVSKVLLYNGADYLGVATLDEGIELRRNNIHVPILLLGYTPNARIDDVIKYDIIQTVFSLKTAIDISRTAYKYSKTAKVHIKIDTGMGRIGFCPTLANIEEIVNITKLEHVEVEGIYTHFSTADEDDISYTRYQREQFLWTIDALRSKGVSIPISHVANSAGSINFDDLYFNMVRPGIIQYGLYPSDITDKNKLMLKPAMSIRTHVSYVKEVKKNTYIGYGRTYKTDKKSKIATIPIGYADGFLRGMSNGGRVLINGQYANITGRICMDQFMVDVTDIDSVIPEDEVVIMGRQGENEISADEIAKVLNTVNYEVICMIGKRVPRKYIKNNTVLKTVKYV